MMTFADGDDAETENEKIPARAATPKEILIRADRKSQVRQFFVLFCLAD